MGPGEGSPDGEVILGKPSGLSAVTRQRREAEGRSQRGRDQGRAEGRRRCPLGQAGGAGPTPGSAGAFRGWKRQEVDSCLEPPEGSQSCGHLDFGLLTSSTVRGHPLALRH